MIVIISVLQDLGSLTQLFLEVWFSWECLILSKRNFKKGDKKKKKHGRLLGTIENGIGNGAWNTGKGFSINDYSFN